MPGSKPTESSGSARRRTHREIERSPFVRERWPSLAAMERNVGEPPGAQRRDDRRQPLFRRSALRPRHVPDRRRCDRWPPGAGGETPRRIPIEEFTRGPYQTTLAPGELLIAVLVPALPPSSGLVHRKISFNERPAITLAANVTVRDGKIERARLAVGSIGIAAQRLTGAEESLHGLDASDPRRTHLDQCLEVAGREAEPVQDANGSIEYKRQLVRVLVERCVREALLEAQAP